MIRGPSTQQPESITLENEAQLLEAASIGLRQLGHATETRSNLAEAEESAEMALANAVGIAEARLSHMLGVPYSNANVLLLKAMVACKSRSKPE